MDAHAERSKLVGRQKQERTELEKKVKKSKGAMKESAQKELDELDKKHEAELTEFDASEGTGKEKAPTKEAAGYSSVALGDFKERYWSGLSAKELQECCTERGISKKGNKEELIIRLNAFHQDLIIQKKEAAAAAAAAAEAEEEEEDEEEEVKAKKEKKEKKKDKKEKKEKKKKKEDEEEEEGEEEGEEEEVEKAPKEKKAKKEKKAARGSQEEEEEIEEDEAAEEDEEDDSDDDEEDDDGPDVDDEELERQGKREKAVQQALRYLLTKKCTDGFPLSEFEAKLDSINVKNFDPTKLGYRTSSIEKFVKLQPPNVLQYDKAKKFIGPPRKKEAKKDEDDE